MKLIPLTQGKFAMVDDEDFERLNQHKWHYSKPNRGVDSGYAKRKNDSVKGSVLLRMHRVILKAPDDMQVDHIDLNKLNNQKSNLRFCSRHQNRFNTKILKSNRSGFKGVSFHKGAGKWRARVKCNGKENYIGLFNTKTKAALAYDELAIKLFGEFARTNSDEGVYV